MSIDKIQDVLNKNIRFVLLRLTGLPGNRQVKDVKVVDTNNNRELDRGLFSSPTLRLIDRGWKSRFDLVHSKVRRLIDAAAPENSDDVPQPIPGCDIVAEVRLNELTASAAAIIDNEFRALVDEFVKVYPDLVDGLRAKINDKAIWEDLTKRIPSAEEVRDKVQLRFEVVPVTFIGDIARPFAENVAASISAGLTKSIEDECAKLAEKIGKRGRFTGDSLNELQSKIRILKDFSFLLSADTLGAVKALERDLGTIASSGPGWSTVLNDSLLHSSNRSVDTLKESLTKLLKNCSDDAAKQKRRTIRI